MSKVRSLGLDALDEIDLSVLREVGNARSNTIWEHSLKVGEETTMEEREGEGGVEKDIEGRDTCRETGGGGGGCSKDIGVASSYFSCCSSEIVHSGFPAAGSIFLMGSTAFGHCCTICFVLPTAQTWLVIY